MAADRLNPDLTEALARGREPRKLWPVLHAIEGRAEDAPGWWESWPAHLAVFYMPIKLMDKN